MSGSLADALADLGGASAPPVARAQLRTLLLEELATGARELSLPRSGYASPVVLALAAGAGELVAVAPVDAGVRNDSGRAGERAWLLVAATVGALADAGDAAAGGAAGGVAAGAWEERWLALVVPAAEPDAALATLAFEEHVAGIDRLRATALALPAHVLEPLGDVRPPLGAHNALRIAEAVARLGGRPADPRSVEELEEPVLAALGAPRAAARPHEDADPARRIARRIVQRMVGMGKWGGYHTAFDHLSRGFEGNERRLAQEVGERLVSSGLLAEKQSVGQRHVYLDPRRAAAVHALVEDGRLPPGLELP